MTPNQLPPLPQPDGQMTVTFGVDEKRKVPVFFGDRLTAYALAALAQQAQEPVAVFDEFKGCPTLLPSAPLLKHGDKLYTTPQPQPAPVVPAPVDERRAFEHWLTTEAYHSHDLRRTAEGPYFNDEVDQAWDAWQARAALQSTAPQATKGQP